MAPLVRGVVSQVSTFSEQQDTKEAIEQRLSGCLNNFAKYSCGEESQLGRGEELLDFQVVTKDELIFKM